MARLSPRHEIWRGLLYGQRSMMLRLMASIKAEYGLTVPQFEALLLLSESPDRRMSASAVAQGLLYSSGSASHLVDRLAERGLVSRSAEPDDARRVQVQLTDTGYALISDAVTDHSRDLTVQFDPLIDDVEVEVLLRFARRLAEAEGVTSDSPTR